MKNFIFLLIFFPVLLFSQTQKKYPTLLWKISGNGLKKPSYLYGTMHVSNRVAYYLSEQFFEALKSVDVVGLETNPGEWMENMEKTGELSRLSQFNNPTNYNKNFYKSTFYASFPEKRMLQGILSYDPDIINGLLYRQNRAKENFEENTYIDLFIFQSASKLNKQLINLENFAQAEIKSRLAALPDENSDESLDSYKNIYSSAQKIEDAYREGDLDMLDSLSKLSSSKNTQRYLINDRNVFFVNTIDSVLKTKTLFSGVGAAHLPGDDGVIELLRKKGYSVEPVKPLVSKKSHETRESLEAIVKPMIFQKQFIDDSLFSVNLPGKLYPIASVENLKYFIHADMVNGNFYTVVRLKHKGPIFNISAQQLLQKVDSLLFEYIPGKITLKKEITSNTGIKGLEIINKTRNGDEQHYQIYFTDLEMILFKIGGKKEYASGNDAKQFFNSIQFTPKAEVSVAFIPLNKGFSVKVPSYFLYDKSEGSSLIGQIEDLIAYNKTKSQFVGVKQAVYNDFNYLEEDTFELNQFAKNTLINFKFKKTPSYEIKKQQGFPCIEFKAKNDAGLNFLGKVFIKGLHYYLVYSVSQKELTFDDEFFSSFVLTDFVYTNTMKEITDRDFYFKAKDEVTDNALSRFNEAYTNAYNKTIVKKDSVIVDYDYRTGNKFYYSPSSNECVNITYEKYNDYDYRNIKEADERIEKSLKNNTSLIISNKTSSNKDGVYAYKCTLKDTATARALDFRMFMKNGVMQEITALFDTTIGLKGWAKDFVESFTPMDTVVGKDIFENKFSSFLSDLSSSDTVLRRRANTSIQGSLGLQKDFSTEFVKFVGSEKINLVSEDSRAQLFVNGGTLENDKIILPYKNLYKQYTDSFYLQLCLLKGIAYLKTQSAYNSFYELIMNETPLVGAENTVSDVFAVLHDSIELCKKFFPGMLTLTKYDEYREAVYSLMADAVNKKVLSPHEYASQKDGILVDANLALKRFNPSSLKSSSDGSFDNLEKSSKELAENLKTALEGLVNNNLYKNLDYLRNLDSYNRPTLVNYAFVLAPFYKTDEKTKNFFTKLYKIKNQTIILPVTVHLLKQNIMVNDTLVEYYSKNSYTRAFFYSELEKEKLTDKFDKKYLSQKLLIESVLLSQKQLSSFYGSEKDKIKKDSLIFMKELLASNKYQKGKIYIYKISKTKANDDEQWSAAFVQDSKEINSKIEIVVSNFTIDKTISEDENVNELLDYFYLSYRKRAIVTANTYE